MSETTLAKGKGTTTEPILEARNVSLSFGSVRALVDVSVTLAPGEVTAIVGDNGAGKSTLVKCVSGIYTIDSGSIRAFSGAGSEVPR